MNRPADVQGPSESGRGESAPEGREPPLERLEMVDRQLRCRGIRDARVLEAMERVPREEFLPQGLRASAFEDRAVPIGEDQTLSQPYMVAAMTQALETRPEDRVLEVGTGSGYQAAVLSLLVKEVFSVERLPGLADVARLRLRELGVRNVRIRVGDGTLGWPEEAPFDGIIVTAAAPDVPAPLLEQLSPEGGRLVIPVGSRADQALLRIVRRGEERDVERLLDCRFVPLVGEEGWATP